MSTNENAEPGMTLRQMAEAILALPAAQQEQHAHFVMIDDEGFEVSQPVLEIRSSYLRTDEILLHGPDLYN